MSKPVTESRPSMARMAHCQLILDMIINPDNEWETVMSILSERLAHDLATLNSTQDEPFHLSVSDLKKRIERADIAQLPQFIKLMVSIFKDRDAISWFRARQPGERDAVNRIIHNYISGQMTQES